MAFLFPSHNPVHLFPVPRLVRATVLAVPLAMGLLGEKEILRVPLIEEVFDRANKPLTWATVELSDPRLEVYSAKLTANARLRGFS